MTFGLSKTSGSPQPTLNETVSVLRRAVAVCPYDHPLKASLVELCCILKPSDAADACNLDSPTTWQSSLTEIHDMAVNVLKKSSLNLQTFLEIHDENNIPQLCNSLSDFNNLLKTARDLYASLDTRGFFTAFYPQQRDHYFLHDFIDRIATDNMSKCTLFEKLHEVFSSVPKILGFFEILAANNSISIQSVRDSLIAAAKPSVSVTPPDEPPPALDASQLTIAANAAVKLHNSLTTVTGKTDVDCCEIIRRLIAHIFHDALPLNSSMRDFSLKLTSSVDPDDMLNGLATGATCSLPGTHTVVIDGGKLFSTGVTVTFFQTSLPNPSARLTFRTSTLALRTMSHPCIQTVYGAHWPDNPGTRAHVVIERRTARLSDARVASLLNDELRLQILKDTSAAIAHIHTHSVYHGAISPDVICLRFEDQTLYGRVKLDVTAIVMRAIAVRNYHLTGIFAPPEIIRGEKSIHFAADVWSFGMLVAYLHNDNPLRFGDSMAAVSAAYSHKVPAFVEDLLAGVRDSSWLSIARDCLKVDARSRPSMTAVLDAVDRLVKNQIDTGIKSTLHKEQFPGTAVQMDIDDGVFVEEEILDSGTGNSPSILHHPAIRTSSKISQKKLPDATSHDESVAVSPRVNNKEDCLNKQAQPTKNCLVSVASCKSQLPRLPSELSQLPYASDPKDRPSNPTIGIACQGNQAGPPIMSASVSGEPKDLVCEAQGATEVVSSMEVQASHDIPRFEPFAYPQLGTAAAPEPLQCSRVQLSNTECSQSESQTPPCTRQTMSLLRSTLLPKSGSEGSDRIGKPSQCSAIFSSPQPTTRFRYNVCAPSPLPPAIVGSSTQPKFDSAESVFGDKIASHPVCGTKRGSSFFDADKQASPNGPESKSLLESHSAHLKVSEGTKIISGMSPRPNEGPPNPSSSESLSHNGGGFQKSSSNTLFSAGAEPEPKDFAVGISVAHSSTPNLVTNAIELTRPSESSKTLRPPVEPLSMTNPVVSVDAFPSKTANSLTLENSQLDLSTNYIERPSTSALEVACANVQIESTKPASSVVSKPIIASIAAPEPQASFPLSQHAITSGVTQQVPTEETPLIADVNCTPTKIVPNSGDMPSKNLVTDVDNFKDNVARAGLKSGENSSTYQIQPNHDARQSSGTSDPIQPSRVSVPQIDKSLTGTSEGINEVTINHTEEPCATSLGVNNPGQKVLPLSPQSALALPGPLDLGGSVYPEENQLKVTSSSENGEKHGEASVSTGRQNEAGVLDLKLQKTFGVSGSICGAEMKEKMPLPETLKNSRNSAYVISAGGDATLASEVQFANKLHDDSKGPDSVLPSSTSVTKEILQLGHSQRRSDEVQAEVILLDDDSSEDSSEVRMRQFRGSLGRTKHVESLSPDSEKGEDTVVLASQQRNGVVVSDEVRRWNREGEMRLTGEGVPIDFPKAVSLFRLAAEKDCPEAHYNLACCYEFERGLEKNEDQANQHYKRAALLGHVRAQVRMAELYEKSDTWTDKEVAFYWYNKAKDHSADAMFKIGQAYECGNGVQKSEETAAHYYELAAEQGNSDSMLSLGNLLRRGCGVATDRQRALELYQQAAEKGNPQALLTLGRWYKDDDLVKDLNKALGCLIRASRPSWSKKGEACFEAGHCYELKGECDQDLERAENFYREAYSLHSGDAAYRLGLLAWKHGNLSQASSWWKLAADMGIHLALVKLGICAEEGKGMRKSASEALKYYKKAMKHNCVEAFSLAGLLYEKGLMSKRNISSAKHKAEAAKYYETGVKHGCIKSMGLLGQCYLTAFGKNQDIQRGISLYRIAASKGDGLSLTELGDCYRDGIGVDCDPKQACEFYKKAANLGYADAEAKYADCLYYGRGTPKDTQRAMVFVEKAIAQDCADGHRIKGDILLEGRDIQKDVDAALCHYRKAVHFKDPAAMIALGKLYESGNEGVAKDLSRAFQLYKRAADQKCNVAMNNLGVMYERGIFVKKCYSKAVEWYEKGRACGGTEATCNLADCYMQGNGVTKDVEMAFRLYRDAAEGGDNAALTELGTCYSEGIGVRKDIKRGIALYEEAHRAGDAEATRRLGVVLLDGVGGIDRDATRGMGLLDEAIENGNLDGLLDKGRFYYIGRGVQKNQSEARKLFLASAKNGNITAEKYLANMFFDGDGGLPLDRERAFKLYNRTLSEIYDQCERCGSEQQPCTST